MRSRTRAERCTRSRARSSRWKSTPAGCAGTSTSTGGLVLAERIAFLLTDRLGRAEAQEIVREAAAATAAAAVSFRDALLADPRAGLEPAELDAALDPSTYLGSSPELVDRALALYESSR